MAAALAAVSAYMQQEQEAYAEALAAALAGPPVRKPNVWGLAGRQDIMGMRQMMQLKAFHRTR